MIFLNQSDMIGTVLWFLLFFVFIFIYPRMMLSQMIWKIEQSARKLEKMSYDANMLTLKKITKKTDKELKRRIDSFSDFFIVEPSSLDPYGIVKKVDQMIRQMEGRFAEFVEEIAPNSSKKEKQEINYALRADIGLRQIAKIVRHNVELAKKFKNLQIAMIIQMQLPLIEKIAESEFKGAEAFVNGWPIGDSIGPMVAASLMDDSKKIAEDVVCGTTVIDGRKCFVLKATGPEPHLGRIDEAIANIQEKNNISRIITIDAALKMEGEKSGAVAEGVGFAMGGFAQREMIEDSLLAKKKPIDSVIVKVGMTEALMHMRKEIMDAIPHATEFVKRAVRRAKKGQAVIIIGVGNSSGIGDSKKTLDEARKIIIKIDKKLREQEKQEKKGSWV
ncbi:MAG: DUF1512 family protein [Candidatus Aenigmarchaeota archaeon]|nr:DUF1512 family protein [Candidatus Aenigmarchaeota archaeon]